MRCLGVLVACGLASAIGCSEVAGLAGGDASTPEAVLHKAEEARKAQDWQTYVDCHTPETHAAMVRQNLETALTLHASKKLAELAGPSAIARVEEKLRPLNEVFAKHGISSADLDALVEMPAGDEKQRALDDMAAKVADKRSFAADMIGFSHKTLTKGAQVEDAVSTIKSVTINGDRATAVISAVAGGGPAIEIPMELKKTSSGWKIDNTQLFQ